MLPDVIARKLTTLPAGPTGAVLLNAYGREGNLLVPGGMPAANQAEWMVSSYSLQVSDASLKLYFVRPSILILDPNQPPRSR